MNREIVITSELMWKSTGSRIYASGNWFSNGVWGIHRLQIAGYPSMREETPTEKDNEDFEKLIVSGEEAIVYLKTRELIDARDTGQENYLRVYRDESKNVALVNELYVEGLKLGKALFAKGGESALTTLDKKVVIMPLTGSLYQELLDERVS